METAAQQLDHTVDIMEAVRTYHNHGLTVIPVCRPLGKGCNVHKNCQAPGKVPTIKNWTKVFRSGAADARILELFQEHDWDLNVGLLTGKDHNLYVIDIDGQEGSYSLACENGLGELTESVTTLTGRVGGSHVLYRPLPDREPLPKKINFLKKVDFIGEGGFVLAPPSKHSSGNPYKFTIDSEERLAELEDPFEVMAEWTYDLVESSGRKSNLILLPLTDDTEVRIGHRALTFLSQGAVDAQREEAVHTVVNLLGRGVDRDEVIQRVGYALMDLSPQTKPEDPWTLDDIERMVGDLEKKLTPAKELPPEGSIILPPKPLSSNLEKVEDQSVSLLQAVVEYENAPLAEPIIEGIIDSGEFVWFYAPPNAGKTFVAMDWAMHVSAGKTYQKRRMVKKGKVLILEQDRFQDLYRYFLTHRETTEWKDEELENLVIHPNPDFSLATREGAVKLIGYVDQVKPDLLIMDACYKFCRNGVHDDDYIWVHQFKEAMVQRGIAVIMLDHTLANPEFGSSEEEGESRTDLDKLYGGQAKRKIVDTGIYMRGYLKDGNVQLRWAKNQGEPKDSLSLAWDPVDGFKMQSNFNPDRHRWTKNETLITQALTKFGPQTLLELIEKTGLSDKTLRRALGPMVVRDQLNRSGSLEGGRGIQATYSLGYRPDPTIKWGS